MLAPVADPFDTAAIRRRVLTAWADSPARFREDANAEEDLVRGGYRDRLLVELAQNAADAATRAGVPGRLRLELTGGELRAANTGEPLDAAGVQALATLRASAKRDGPATVGRFGVGFAAVLAVSDEPAVVSTTGGGRLRPPRPPGGGEGVPALAGGGGGGPGRPRGEEPLSLPVRRIAPFPRAPDRRHVAPGPVTDALVAEAARGYAELLRGLPPDPALLALVPRIGLAAAELDAA